MGEFIVNRHGMANKIFRINLQSNTPLKTQGLQESSAFFFLFLFIAVTPCSPKKMPDIWRQSKRVTLTSHLAWVHDTVQQWKSLHLWGPGDGMIDTMLCTLSQQGFRSGLRHTSRRSSFQLLQGWIPHVRVWTCITLTLSTGAVIDQQVQSADCSQNTRRINGFSLERINWLRSINPSWLS